VSLISGAFFRGDPTIKPEAWGPVEDVQAAIKENIANIYGIPAPFLYMPVWEKNGQFAGTILSRTGSTGYCQISSLMVMVEKSLGKQPLTGM